MRAIGICVLFIKLKNKVAPSKSQKNYAHLHVLVKPLYYECWSVLEMSELQNTDQ